MVALEALWSLFGDKQLWMCDAGFLLVTINLNIGGSVVLRHCGSGLILKFCSVKALLAGIGQRKGYSGENCLRQGDTNPPATLTN